jgi:hypothetical protein
MTTNRYEVVYGSKYDKSLSRKEIAVRVRADIKEAVKAGELPTAKYSVRIESYSGGGSINVTVTGLPFEVLNEERSLADHDQPNVFCRINWMSDKAMAVDAAIDAILAAYNFDGSDIQSDYFHVNFYSHVRIETDEAAERAAIVARRDAEDARLEALATAERAEVRADNLAASLSDETFTVCFY